MRKSIGALFIIVCLETSARAGQRLCLQSEVVEYCQNPCEPTCQNPQKSCPSVHCESDCICPAGTVRDETTGQCVIPLYCPTACPLNEVPNDYQGKCEPTCQNKNGFYCTAQNKKCVCKPGYFRDLNSGKCVRPDHCPKVCSDFQEWSTCSNVLCRKTCQSPSIEPLHCAKDCTPGCKCIKGYVWDEYSRRCIPQPQCPRVCGVNEIWKNCSDKYCRRTCQSPLPKPCPKICVPGCSCRDGFIWDEQLQQCISISQCPTACGSNQIWKPCSDANCRATCQKPHPLICTLECTPGCSCRDGYIWDDYYKQCVPRGTCP